MGASASDSEYVTALAREREQATSSSSEFVAAIEEQIERSKSHWSELAEPDSNVREEEVAAEIDNKEKFMTLQMHPIWGRFFRTFGYRLGVPGLGQYVTVRWKWARSLLRAGRLSSSMPTSSGGIQKSNERDLELGREEVVKIFKKGTLLRHVQLQWPEGMLQFHAERSERSKLGKSHEKRYRCDVYCAILLEDGRFAFLMRKEHEDLRNLIDRKMLESGHGCRPFQNVWIVEKSCTRLHLGWFGSMVTTLFIGTSKASNVLCYKDKNMFRCVVADFECSIGVVGTRFWRAPEILQACKDRNINQRQELFTKAADTYSYGMTCYEILTERIPFQFHPVTNKCQLLTDLVINQHLRPEVPDFVDDWARDLLCQCWQSDPAARPTFEEILSVLEKNSNSAYIRRKAFNRRKAVEVQIPTFEVPATD